MRDSSSNVLKGESLRSTMRREKKSLTQLIARDFGIEDITAVVGPGIEMPLYNKNSEGYLTLAALIGASLKAQSEGHESYFIDSFKDRNNRHFLAITAQGEQALRSMTPRGSYIDWSEDARAQHMTHKYTRLVPENNLDIPATPVFRTPLRTPLDLIEDIFASPMPASLDGAMFPLISKEKRVSSHIAENQYSGLGHYDIGISDEALVGDRS